MEEAVSNFFSIFRGREIIDSAFNLHEFGLIGRSNAKLGKGIHRDLHNLSSKIFRTHQIRIVAPVGSVAVLRATQILEYYDRFLQLSILKMIYLICCHLNYIINFITMLIRLAQMFGSGKQLKT